MQLRGWSSIAVGVVALAAACGTEGVGPAGPATSLITLPGSDGGTGSSGGPPVQGVQGVPCEVAQLLATHCTVCHGDPPILEAPMSLLSAEDLAASPADRPDASYAELSLQRMRDVVSPMPPGGGGPTGAEIDTFAAWVDSGSPAGSCDAVSDPFATDTVCTSEEYWRGGDEESPEMHPGDACIDCHRTGVSREGERERGPLFSLAGTVYATGHEPTDCNGVDGKRADVLIEVTDARGNLFRLRPNQAGNFYREDSDVVFPVTARVLFEGRTRAMQGAVDSGDCNSCHTEQGAEQAPGRIMLP